MSETPWTAIDSADAAYGAANAATWAAIDNTAVAADVANAAAFAAVAAGDDAAAHKLAEHRWQLAQILELCCE